ncbi:MAG: putative toxin-antitoxin system toxin component, PIN family [Actinomycetota bacterium]
MVRAVLDPNVIISALLSPKGAPAETLRVWIGGAFELIVSPLLLVELERALAYPKLRKRINAGQASLVIDWLQSSATVVKDPREPPSVRSPDPGDDYLIALAESEQAVLVSGDDHLLRLSKSSPIYSVAQFLRFLGPDQGRH